MRIKNLTNLRLYINDIVIKQGEHSYKNLDPKDSDVALQLKMLRGAGYLSFDEILESDNVSGDNKTTDSTGQHGATDSGKGKLSSQTKNESGSGGGLPKRRNSKHQTVKVCRKSGKKKSKLDKTAGTGA